MSLPELVNGPFPPLPDRSTLLEIIANPQSPAALELVRLADRLRARTVGNEVHLRGLIEFSNYCRRNCLYCGLRRDNHRVARYRMAPEEIIATAKHGVELGFKTVVLQSGEDLAYTDGMLTDVILEIRRLGLVVTLSVGRREPKEYESWRLAGAERFLMRHETADPVLYARLHPGETLFERISALKVLKELDYQVGTGFMVGLPGQTPEILYRDLRLAEELEAEMVGIGPFIPHPDTPLGQSAGGAEGNGEGVESRESEGQLSVTQLSVPQLSKVGLLQQTLLMVALARLVLPDALIPATTAMGSIHPTGREQALQAGANVMMPNLTPPKYRADYQIYPNKICLGEAASECRGCVTKRIESIGRTVAEGSGHHQTWLRRQSHE